MLNRPRSASHHIFLFCLQWVSPPISKRRSLAVASDALAVVVDCALVARLVLKVQSVHLPFARMREFVYKVLRARYDGKPESLFDVVKEKSFVPPAAIVPVYSFPSERFVTAVLALT